MIRAWRGLRQQRTSRVCCRCAAAWVLLKGSQMSRTCARPSPVFWCRMPRFRPDQYSPGATPAEQRRGPGWREDLGAHRIDSVAVDSICLSIPAAAGTGHADVVQVARRHRPSGIPLETSRTLRAWICVQINAASSWHCRGRGQAALTSVLLPFGLLDPLDATVLQPIW